MLPFLRRTGRRKGRKQWGTREEKEGGGGEESGTTGNNRNNTSIGVNGGLEVVSRRPRERGEDGGKEEPARATGMKKSWQRWQVRFGLEQKEEGEKVPASLHLVCLLEGKQVLTLLLTESTESH